ncbi:hypothetical protein LSAT2_027523 [Lamellibrachia satsuma]|nr:hypothetical protein LSAT2_027523 [Lamellibrachia satsuma]
MDTHWRTTAKLSMAVWSYLAVNNKMVRSFPAATFEEGLRPAVTNVVPDGGAGAGPYRRHPALPGRVGRRLRRDYLAGTIRAQSPVSSSNVIRFLSSFTSIRH